MCSPKPDKEIQKFYHKSSSTYISKLSKTKECPWGLKGAPERRGQAGPQQTNSLRSTAQAWEGVPPTPTALTGTRPGELGAILFTTIKLNDTFAWLQDHHITTLHLHVTLRQGMECKGCGIWIQRDPELHFNSVIYELLHSAG